MQEKLESFENRLNELSRKIDDISAEITDSVNSAISDAMSDVECVVEDAAESAVNAAIEDAISNLNFGQAPLITVFSQDKKFIIPVYSFEARRAKKGEEPYLITAQYSPSGNIRTIGRYPNKEAALAEMQKLFKAVYGGPKFYEIK